MKGRPGPPVQGTREPACDLSAAAGPTNRLSFCHQVVAVHNITIDPPVTPKSTACALDGRAHRTRRHDGELGALSLMIVVLFVAFACLAGIVVDGGAKLTADETAAAVAQEAARAGAMSVDASTAYASGTFVVGQQAALAAARNYLTSAGFDHYSVSAVGSRAIRVSVTIVEPTKFLLLIGIRSFTCTQTATASLVTGVTGGT